MGQSGYKILYRGGTGEIEEKKSRFIAHVNPAATEEEAQEFIAAVKKQYWDARHNCYAFVIGEHQELTRCSDDGEPAGTAGRPMLDVLLKEEIHNAVVVVTRYFGGTLLGTGGLVRAYQKAVQEGLLASFVTEKKNGRKLTIRTDYNGIGRIQYLLGEREIPILDSSYTDSVEITALVPEEEKEQTETAVIDATNGKVTLSWSNPVCYAEVDKEIKFFEK